jgi:hypothetical protein
MEPSDYYDAPINKVLHFIRRTGIRLNKKGEAQQIIEGHSAKARRAHPLCIHSFTVSSMKSINIHKVLHDSSTSPYCTTHVWFNFSCTVGGQQMVGMTTGCKGWLLISGQLQVQEVMLSIIQS